MEQRFLLFILSPIFAYQSFLNVICTELLRPLPETLPLSAILFYNVSAAFIGINENTGFKNENKQKN